MGAVLLPRFLASLGLDSCTDVCNSAPSSPILQYANMKRYSVYLVGCITPLTDPQSGNVISIVVDAVTFFVCSIWRWGQPTGIRYQVLIIYQHVIHYPSIYSSICGGGHRWIYMKLGTSLEYLMSRTPHLSNYSSTCGYRSMIFLL